jgi:hypothetical protein
MSDVTLFVDPDGTVRYLHDDDTTQALKDLGSVRIKRASHVEWDDEAGKWWVDLGPTCRGEHAEGFVTREDALLFEQAWINSYMAGKELVRNRNV